MMRKARLGENVYMLGGALSGFAASACCVGPLVLMGLGIGGVVGTGAFEALAPYRPFFIIMSAVLLSLAFHRLYLAPRDCVVGGMCADPHTLRIKRGLWWLVSGISLVSIAFA